MENWNIAEIKKRAAAYDKIEVYQKQVQAFQKKMQEADIFCDATGVGMHPLEDLSNIPDPSYFRKDLIVTDTVYAPRETVMMKQAKAAGCERVYNGMCMMLFQALIAIKLYTGKDTPVDYMKEKLGI